MLFAIEFLADKVPVVDSVWDATHTVIRPIGGALLASRALGDLSPVAEVLALLLLGGATLATHAAKATTRLAVNTSPEPVSNVLVSLAENGLVAGAVWLALAHPLLALGAGLVALAVAVALIAWLARRAWAVLGRLRAPTRPRARARRRRRAGSARTPPPPPPHLRGVERDPVAPAHQDDPRHSGSAVPNSSASSRRPRGS